jgi:hypothetical protein
VQRRPACRVSASELAGPSSELIDRELARQ